MHTCMPDCVIVCTWESMANFVSIYFSSQNVCTLLRVSRSEDIAPKIHAMMEVIESQGNMEKVLDMLHFSTKDRFYVV